MGNHHWKKIAAVMLAAAIGIQPVYVQAKTREEIQQEREQKKSEQQGTQSQYKQSQSKVSSLEGQQDALEEEIQELDSQLVGGHRQRKSDAGSDQRYRKADRKGAGGL